MNIVIVDDDSIVSSSLQIIIENAGHKVLSIGSSGLEAIRLYEIHQPDAILMDIRMDEMNGVEASREILLKYPKAKVLFLTTFEDDQYIQEALELGVKGYLLKQDFDKVVSALEAVMNGHNVYNSNVLKNISSYSKRSLHPGIKELNDKELAIIQLVAKGQNNKEIASTIFMSEGSVRNLLSTILSKLQLRDRTQLAIFYYQNMN